MQIIKYRGLKIFHNPNRTEAVLFAHGSYRPSTLFVRGTRKVVVPQNLTVHFYTAKRNFAVGSAGRINEALQGQSRTPAETVTAGQLVRNYNLSHKERESRYEVDDWLLKESARNYIGVRKDANATLADVFDAIVFFQLNYTTLHNYHCRVTEQQAEQFHRDLGDA